MELQIDGAIKPLRVLSTDPLVLTADPYIFNIPPATGRTVDIKFIPKKGLQLVVGNGKDTCSSAHPVFGENTDHIEVHIPGNSNVNNFCLAGRERHIVIKPTLPYNSYYSRDGIKYVGQEINGCKFEVWIPVQPGEDHVCTINPDTIKLVIDSVPVPLKVYGQGTPTEFRPVDSSYEILVDGTTGRTLQGYVYGNGIDLFPFQPNLPNPPCGNGLNYFLINEPFNVTCFYQNPGSILIPPGDAYYRVDGFLYYGAQDPGDNKVQSWCEFVIRVPIRRTKPVSTCPIVCKEQVVTIPSTRLEALVNDVGFQMNLSGYPFVECIAGAANTASAEAIRKLIIGGVQCDDPGVTVTVVPNGDSPNCVTVTIKNSPLKIEFLKAGGTYYKFSWLKC